LPDLPEDPERAADLLISQLEYFERANEGKESEHALRAPTAEELAIVKTKLTDHLRKSRGSYKDCLSLIHCYITDKGECVINLSQGSVELAKLSNLTLEQLRAAETA
jgi:hypothetical protein